VFRKAVVDHPIIVALFALCTVVGIVAAVLTMDASYGWWRRVLTGASLGFFAPMFVLITRFMGAFDGDESWEGHADVRGDLDAVTPPAADAFAAEQAVPSAPSAK